MAVDTQPAGEATTTTQAGTDLADVVSPSPADLARIVETSAASNEWIGRVRLRARSAMVRADPPRPGL